MVAYTGVNPLELNGAPFRVDLLKALPAPALTQSLHAYLGASAIELNGSYF